VTPERLREIEKLFHEARVRTPAERDSFLARACEDDPALRREVESLLAQPPAGVIDAPIGALVAELVLQSSQMRPPPVRIGKYLVEQPLGRGGMGVVLLAFDPTLERRVAIKLLEMQEGEADNATAHARTLREARSASALNHPHICTIFEAGEDDGRAFIAMEYIDGHPLSDVVARGPLPVEEAVRYGAEAADAVAHAHDRGVIHGDLKAANVMVSASGRLKIVDFGLARRLNANSTDLTAVPPHGVAVAVGTPYAMAPEQTRGAVADVRSDVWGLGVLLHEMLAGARPFTGATPLEVFSSILRNPPAALPPHVSGSLRDIVLKCLAKDPLQRYQRAADLRLILEVTASGLRRRDRPPSASTLAAGDPLPAAPAIDAQAPIDFVGRDRELEQLAEVWRHVTSGHRQLVMISGEAGIGKTRLALTFGRRAADDGATVLVGRSDEEALVPYQPFVEALSWYVRVCPEADLRSAVATSSGGEELAQLVPDVMRRCPDMPASTVIGAESQRYRLFEAVATLLAAASRARPLLLVLDDLHWADKPTLLLLRHIVRASDPAALCIAGTYRDSELARTHPLAEMLADLRREPIGVTRLALRGLDEPQVQGLVRSVTGYDAPETLGRAVFDSTGGNPFFVGEMLRHLHETGGLVRQDATATAFGLPAGVKEVIGRRLSRTSEDCNRALTLAAVIGRDFDAAVLEALGDLPGDRLLDALDEAARAHLITELVGGRGRFSFLHALIRETLYDELGSSRRIRLHRRVAEAIEHLTQGRTNPPLADLAHHFAQSASAGVAAKAVDYATRAGDRAADGLAFEEAARLYELGLQSLEFEEDEVSANVRRVDLHGRRAKVFGGIGQWMQQRQEVERALRYLDPQQEERRCALLIDLANASFFLLDMERTRRSATEALELATRLQRNDYAADALAWLARWEQANGNLVAAIEMDRAAFTRSGGRSRYTLMNGTLSLYLAGRSSEALDQDALAVGAARSTRDAEQMMFSLAHCGLNLSAVGRYRDAHQVFEEVRGFGRKFGVIPPLARALTMWSSVHLSVFDFDGADALQREARDLAQRVSFPPSYISAGIDMLLACARRGDPGGADALLQETADAAARTPGWHEWLWRLRLGQVRAELALARGDFEAAVAEATAGIANCHAMKRPKYEALALITRAHAFNRLRRTSEAIADARWAVALADAMHDPAIQLVAVDLMLALDGTDELARDARAIVHRIQTALPETMRRPFSNAEIVGRITRPTRLR
jgi:predicted Ser/Thr protein kinase/tetratricopeptide (TPR) repeat protein